MGKWEIEESEEPLEKLKISGDAQTKTFPQMNSFHFDQTKKKKVVWNVFVLKRAENENKEHSAIMDEEPDESAEMNFNWREVLQFFFPDLMQHPHNQVIA